MLSIVALCLLAPTQATQVDVAAANPLAEVVSLLQDMLEKSKKDGTDDRTAYAKFKCYCDTNTDEKVKAIANATAEIELMDAELADLKSRNEKLSQEVYDLKNNMDANEASREEATTIRDKEKADFEKEEQDLVTGIDQLGRAIDLLSAVGADQTVSSGADNEQLMAADATAAAGGPSGSFMAKSANMKKVDMSKLDKDMKAALRAASVFLTSSQRKKVTSFLAVASNNPFGNYNSQSGEIVGVLKSMHDTFKSNLENARAAEKKAQEEYDEFMELKKAEFEEMETSYNDKKDEIGTNAEAIATTESEKETLAGELAENQAFLEALTDRCGEKKKQFEKRNFQRAQEEAAIAEAISILNSDSAFDTFQKTSGGDEKFVQLKSVSTSALRLRALRLSVLKSLLAVAKKTKSVRMARAVAALAAENPFDKVLSMIREVITAIEKEEGDDVAKKDWCEVEQSTNEASKADKESDLSTLQTNINSYEEAVEASKSNIELANEDLSTNRDSQTSEAENRKEAHELFQETLGNLQDAESILKKAIEVLSKYYSWLERANGPHTYEQHAQKDSGGGNLERLAGKSIEELEKACSELPNCAGFNSAGWLKGSIAEPAEWYAWDDGDLYVKVYDKAMLQEEPEEGPELSKGQGEDGNKALEMIEFILKDTQESASTAMDDEKTNQAQFETNMEALTESEAGLIESIAEYGLDLANTEKSLEQAHEDLATTEKEHKAIVEYLAQIEPGCTFIQTNYETRKQNRETEKKALEGAIDTLEASPAFKNFQAGQESEDLGECSEKCEGKKETNTAECQACQEGVTIFGYCAQNSDTPGCDEATKTGSADAMNAEQ